MQSLSKIERGLNYPSYETLEKIMEVLDVTPNELLSGEWKYINQSEKEVCQFLRAEERLNAEFKHGHYDNFIDSEEEWLKYELEREYITDYINGEHWSVRPLPDSLIKTEFVQNQTFANLDVLKLQLADYVNWFNNHRIHSSLGYLTPAEYRMNNLKKVV